ncbi:hypothetical protein [Desulfoferrobacter suflitae]|uniref:hypothetical protein n=1 Tax=Desulfoferrobacter suflitae TaxID=2865782 RepID=UPI002164CF2D|nr:hypothetical protein [Desulfoferrobacter suflitae]MCK8603219.1 hypothetical protein [Desulfoferrobacter suflitae]
MKLFKLITGGLVMLVIGLFFWQNVPTFTTPLPFQLNLYIKEHLQWSLQVYVLLVLAGFLGFAVGIVLMLRPYFNVRRMLAHERQEKLQPVPPQPTQEAPPEKARENLQESKTESDG